MLKIWMELRNFLCKYSPEIFIFFSRIFLTRFQNLVLKLHTELATDTSLLKKDKFGSNFVLMKQNLCSHRLENVRWFAISQLRTKSSTKKTSQWRQKNISWPEIADIENARA